METANIIASNIKLYTVISTKLTIINATKSRPVFTSFSLPVIINGPATTNPNRAIIICIFANKTSLAYRHKQRHITTRIAVNSIILRPPIPESG